MDRRNQCEGEKNKHEGEFDVTPHEAYDPAISAIFIVAMLIVTMLMFVVLV